MKQFRLLLLTGFILTTLIGCKYEGFEEDYDYSTVYFANQFLKRTFVVDEINTIKVGVVLGGKRYNEADEWIRYSYDDTTGLSATSYEIMPDSYFTLSDEQEMIISEGSFMGEVTITIDPAFFDDAAALDDHYVLPFRIEDTSTDSILSGKDSLLLIMVFESPLFGNYYHNGRVLVKDPIDGSILDTIIYHQEDPVTENVNLWTLYTKGRKSLYTRGIGKYAPSDLTGFFIDIAEDNTLSYRNDTALVARGFDWKLKTADGDNYYNPQTRTLFMNYSYTDVKSFNICFVTDTLIFRNRILDGVNQWEF